MKKQSTLHMRKENVRLDTGGSLEMMVFTIIGRGMVIDGKIMIQNHIK